MYVLYLEYSRIVYFQAVNESLLVSKNDPAAKVYAMSLLDKLETVSVVCMDVMNDHVIRNNR